MRKKKKTKINNNDNYNSHDNNIFQDNHHSNIDMWSHKHITLPRCMKKKYFFSIRSSNYLEDKIH
ncbi:hypothetical protein PFDG_05030 [Plasmodium falciparum Dd2]|uniref:Uncharacterized protein n=1 Tax=Plasmodium falciparum (isolate Dd2) TaxID=57267 RepID=A0A0L7M9I3_PLAF4|nr:hypothetical protein PFDG_05030 [Plasmodium falciparum Dd2]